MPQPIAIPSKAAGRSAFSKHSLFQLFPWVWLAVSYIGTMLVMCLCCRGYIDSDMSSEMVLADLLNQEGGLLSTNWWYSTELRVFYLQIFQRLGLLLFPGDWFAARMFSQGLWLLVFVLAYLYMARGLGLRSSGAWGAAALMCPFGSWYFWYVPFGGYYLPHALLVMLSFGAMLHLVRPAPPVRRILQILLLLFSCGASGLNGVKGLMAFYLPMLLAAGTAIFLQLEYAPKHSPRAELRLLGVAFFGFLAAGAGYLVNSTILASNHHFISYNEQTWNILDLDTLLNKWGEFLSLFGYPSDSLMGNQVPLFSLVGILGAFGLLTAGALVFSLFRLLFRWKEVRDLRFVSVLLLASILLVQGIAFACTGTPGSINASYWLTIIPFVFPVLQLEGETEHFRLPGMRQAAAGAFVLCIVASSVGTVLHFFDQPLRADPRLETVCNALVDYGCTAGFASFWNGNVLTEWSSGQLEVWVVPDYGAPSATAWLQKTDHATLPEGEVFLLSTYSELSSMGLDELPAHSNVIYNDDEGFVVMTYPSTDEMVSVIHSVNPPTE